MINVLIFYAFAALTLVSAVLVIVQKNAMRSVLYLAFTVLSTSGIFLSLQAEYLAAIQVLVYGGGIVVLYIFVIIIVNLKEIKAERRKMFPKLFIFILPAVLLIQIVNVLFTNQSTPPAGTDAGLEFRTMAEMLFTNYLVPFELASVLLLAVLIGAVIIARRRLVNDPD